MAQAAGLGTGLWGIHFASNMAFVFPEVQSTVYWRNWTPSAKNETSSKEKNLFLKWAGANEWWHVDGYDKLEPFGFPIHGAVDGYSRRVLWLKVTPSNSNPSIVANFFLDCVSQWASRLSEASQDRPRDGKRTNGNNAVFIESKWQWWIYWREGS